MIDYAVAEGGGGCVNQMRLPRWVWCGYSDMVGGQWSIMDHAAGYVWCWILSYESTPVVDN